jgi:hypothetical protein
LRHLAQGNGAKFLIALCQRISKFQIIHDEEFHGEGILTINVSSEEKGKDKGIVKI